MILHVFRQMSEVDYCLVSHGDVHIFDAFAVRQRTDVILTAVFKLEQGLLCQSDTAGAYCSLCFVIKDKMLSET